MSDTAQPTPPVVPDQTPAIVAAVSNPPAPVGAPPVAVPSTGTVNVPDALAIRKSLLSVRPSLRAELHDVLTSKKFWALVIALVTTASAAFTGQIDAIQAIQAVVAAVGAYTIGQGIADSNKLA